MLHTLRLCLSCRYVILRSAPFAQTHPSILGKRGWKLNTSFVEHLNLDLRQHVAAIGRRVNTLCKHEAGLRQQLALFHTYHNFVLPHTSLRVPLPRYDPRDGDGQKMATADARHGRWPDGSGVEPARGADVSCAAVAAAPGKLRIWRGQGS